jgi:hypothetical protein
MNGAINLHAPIFRAGDVVVLRSGTGRKLIGSRNRAMPYSVLNRMLMMLSPSVRGPVANLSVRRALQPWSTCSSPIPRSALPWASRYRNQNKPDPTTPQLDVVGTLDSQHSTCFYFLSPQLKKRNPSAQSPDPIHSPSRQLINVGLQVDIKPAVVRPPEEVPGPGSYEPHLSEQLLTLEKLRHSSMFSRSVSPITQPILVPNLGMHLGFGLVSVLCGSLNFFENLRAVRTIHPLAKDRNLCAFSAESHTLDCLHNFLNICVDQPNSDCDLRTLPLNPDPSRSPASISALILIAPFFSPFYFPQHNARPFRTPPAAKGSAPCGAWTWCVQHSGSRASPHRGIHVLFRQCYGAAGETPVRGMHPFMAHATKVR